MLKDITTKLCILSEEVMKYDKFMEILKKINDLSDLSKDNIVEKIKAKLQEEDPDLCQEWEKSKPDNDSGSGINYIFTISRGQNSKEVKLLHLASYWNCANVAKALIENGADINAEHDNKMAPLHLAITNGHKEIVQVLSKAEGINVDAKNSDGWTPLHLAAAKGHKDVVETLIANKVRGCPETSKFKHIPSLT
ncbi:ankyrin repeat domain-containing protein [Wolbachia endosymbiont of Drosophila incompta]|uniref:ankyrin repeat domain-containing protein n=1 Tax=Wolbachia endosymbiont of Drosophila incompta TaxID=1633785 RepID=UPI000877D1BB|nr:ankyrin repeat domain-containing protein [Wolbachia endosymbiont of Drosophila incompta]